MNLNLGRVFRNGFGVLFAIWGFLICGCSTPPETKVDEADTTPGVAVIEAVRTDATPGQAIITFVCSKKTSHGDPFAVANPSRISFDIKGAPADDLPGQVKFQIGPVKEILIKEKTGGIAGVVVYVRHEVNHSRLIKRGKDIVLEITPKITEKAAPVVQPSPGDTAASSLAQILGLTVTQHKGNRTLLSVRTNKEVKYDVKLDRMVLIIDLNNGTIQPDLMKELDSEHTAGAVSRVNVFYSALDHHISLRITLRKLVPYHMTQDGKVLNIDFDAITGEIPAVAKRPALETPLKKIETPAVKKTESTAVKRAFGKDKGSVPAKPISRAEQFEATSKQYAGQRMSFDFVDTDIRNILQLISEVAGINIVWGSDVEGKISMKLDNIPWDQALEMILRPNGLTYQIEDDVLWVVPKEKLRDMEIKEGKRKGALMAAKRLQGIFEAKIIEFITVRNRKASDIFKMLVGDPNADPPIMPALDIEGAESEEKEEGEEEKGKKVKIATLDLYLSYDPGTNMIIANGVRAKVDKVKELIAKLDIAEKQVMIEARVVDAVTAFTRDLGIQWQSLDGKTPGIKGEWYNSATNSWGGGQFSTSAPTNWNPNIGVALGWLTGGGLGSIALDASLALGETQGKVNVISAPKALVVNGQEAFISRGEVTYQPIVSLDTVDVKEMEAVLSLKVTPTISADNTHITMTVEVTDNRATPGEKRPTPGGGEQETQPGRTEKQINTTLMIKTGDTVVIGGIYHKRTQTVDTGVPWLMDIPLLGWLFKAQRKEIEKTELLIFITPTVVDTLTANDER